MKYRVYVAFLNLLIPNFKSYQGRSQKFFEVGVFEKFRGVSDFFSQKEKERIKEIFQRGRGFDPKKPPWLRPWALHYRKCQHTLALTKFNSHSHQRNQNENFTPFSKSHELLTTFKAIKHHQIKSSLSIRKLRDKFK